MGTFVWVSYYKNMSDFYRGPTEFTKLVGILQLFKTFHSLLRPVISHYNVQVQYPLTKHYKSRYAVPQIGIIISSYIGS
jgi:hypothetical protein